MLHFEFIEEDPSTIQCILAVTIPTPSGNARRSYSTTPTFGKRFEAKGEAAAIAVSMGALDFLKSALSPITHCRDKIDLLAQASETPLDDGKVDMVAGERAMEEIEQLCEQWRPGGTVQPEYIPFKLGKNNQGKFDTLTRPFVESIDKNKGVYEHHWSSRLNIIIQGAKMHTCRASYHFSSSGTKSLLTGCVLRIVITHPPILSALGFSGGKELVKTYVVDPHFVKSNDAKIAKYEEKTQATREFDRTTSENFVKVLGKLLMRLDPGGKILFDYFGSGVPVKAKGMAAHSGLILGRRTFSVPAQYPSKLESKTAAILEAAKAGLVELLRYPAGTEPPERYVSYWDTLSKHESYDVNSSDGDTDDEDPGKTKAMKKKLKRKRKAEKKKADKQASGVPVCC
ncbi:hypothetical protein H1R20_g1835, partial [Candolleomyces eurysporus]